MATMAAETTLQNGPSRIERLSAEDFETASIRSAAPSYISEAPSYHSTLPTNESVPEYTPRESQTTTSATSPPRYATSSSMLNLSSTPTPTPMTSTFAPGAGLPRLPSPRRDVPHLSHFQIPSWSSMASNPQARHYQRVAHRRVSAAANGGRWGGVESALRSAIERINANAAAAAADAEDDPDKVRPLEDPYLVGEEAAARARRERLARQNGDEVLYREERRWDWFLGQTRDWDERNRSWGAFSTTIDSRGRLARRFGR
ncbi:uncharacterized protein GGS22DRAFT_187263 [Annulohypoxylon maeteangense]|uniref:uncharacterized protein n=1 Tax=Annulohypoxylon maeteangense TaxID=1927788 RepID=UPI002007EDB8|nr:uncharacterized protein GGS22DRAFT_187263 [Annulohypoxylon maeteangense]KAI0886032.1 hypothetical protein GGS22DRAFT_187263 [Annulohypoxylon maeteangense]